MSMVMSLVAFPIWKMVGVIGGVLFYGRFYVQWIASEMRRRSVVPVAFWYMSSAGSLMLLAWAVVSQSPLGALGQSVNIVIYSRNLVHIWRERGALSRAAHRAIHALVAVITLASVCLVVLTWQREVVDPKGGAHEHARTWFWLGVGLAGQLLFALRFLVQWIATERKRKSVIPPVFWHLSVWAALLQGATFFQRHEWVFAFGMTATLLIYVRNLWLIHVHPERAEPSDAD